MPKLWLSSLYFSQDRAKPILAVLFLELHSHVCVLPVPFPAFHAVPELLYVLTGQRALSVRLTLDPLSSEAGRPAKKEEGGVPDL